MATKKTRPAKSKPATMTVVKNPAEYQALIAPSFTASSVSAQENGTEFVLIFAAGKPMTNIKTGITDGMKNEAVCTITASPQSVKDFAMFLALQIKKYEEAYGVIDTPYLRRIGSAHGNQAKKTG